MAKKLISYDDEATGLGLPEVVEEGLNAAYADIAVAERSALPLPLREVTLTARGSDPIPTDFFWGTLWGVEGATILASTDSGTSWQTVTTVTGLGNIQRLMPCDDGEVLAVSTTEVRRSTGWGAGTPTWQVVLSNPTPSFFYPWGIDGDGNKFVIVHYSGSGTQTPDRADSRYGWISVDGGKTWSIKWDVEAKWNADVNSRTHIHAAAYDPWEDRFFIAEGHDEVTGVYVSYDDGDSWSKIPYGPNFDSPPGNSPTVIKPTDYGVVFGSDDPTNGVMVMPRGTNEIVRAYSRNGVSNTTLFGYAHMGARDPRTGLVYMVWEVNQATNPGLPAIITGSDGQVADSVWQAPDATTYLWRRIVIDDHGVLFAWEQATNQIARGKVAGMGARPAHLDDSGRTFGGRVNGTIGAVAVGVKSYANGNRTVAIGEGQASGHGGVAIGTASTVNNGVAIGDGAVSDANGLAFGPAATTINGTTVGLAARSGHASSLAMGREARAVRDDDGNVTSSTAVGYQAKASGSAGSGTAVGGGAVASGNRATAIGAASIAANSNSTAIGQGSEVSGSNQSTVIGVRAKAVNALEGTAIGYEALAQHTGSVAIGVGTQTSGTGQVAVGARDVEIQDANHGLILRSPDGARWRVKVSDAGELTVDTA